ncbi:tryptophan synthase subunit alpha [Uliginosibacterium sp. H1]|uniref:tryptophan synthase subunit alpha n=1 Tax=Uliginosibacterium sp. H1 TaxID=3114757 RepID=UPI002E17781E|nr:tryptophan synthase subunit alpha [Uliginosibacterium sp. H1]
MSRIAAVFERLNAEGRKALIPYITAGDPDAETTLPLMHGLVAAGSDIIELGVPFSDPMADGPTIQRASERALAKGMSLKGVLEIVRRFRETDAQTAVVLMGYANPVEAMGVDSFVAQAKAAGVDGVLIVDYPPQECRELSAKLKAVSIDPIFLLAPTSMDARFAEVAEAGSGYIYYVSLKGVTGAGHLDLQEVARRIPVIRQKVGMPVGVGFGIRDAATAAGVAGFADAVVVGSRIIEEIEQSPRGEVVARVQNFVAGLRQAIDQVKEGVQA